MFVQRDPNKRVGFKYEGLDMNRRKSVCPIFMLFTLAAMLLVFHIGSANAGAEDENNTKEKETTSYYSTSNLYFLGPAAFFLFSIAVAFISIATATKMSGRMGGGFLLIILGAVASVALISQSFLFESGEDFDKWVEDEPGEGDSIQVGAFIEKREETEGYFTYNIEGSDEQILSKDDIGEEGDFVTVEIQIDANGISNVSSQINTWFYIAPGLVFMLIGIILVRSGRKKVGGSTFKSGLLYQKLIHVQADRLDERISHVDKSGTKLESPYKKEDGRSLLDLPMVDDVADTQSKPVFEPDVPEKISASSKTRGSKAARSKRRGKTHVAAGGSDTESEIDVIRAGSAGDLDLMINLDTLEKSDDPESDDEKEDVESVPGKSSPTETKESKQADTSSNMRAFKCASCETTFSLKTDKDKILCPGCGLKYELPK